MAPTTKKDQVTRNPEILDYEAKPAEQKPVVEAPTFYPAEDDVNKPLVNKWKPKPTKLRTNITPRTVSIVLSGRFKGKSGKQLAFGVLLLTGPFKMINGVSLRRVNLRRVNQANRIANSTKVDISGVNADKFVNNFAKQVEKKKGEGEIAELEEEEKNVPPQEKKDDLATSTKVDISGVNDKKKGEGEILELEEEVSGFSRLSEQVEKKNGEGEIAELEEEEKNVPPQEKKDDLATSTKVDISGVNDKKKGEGEILELEEEEKNVPPQEKNVPPQEKKDDQKALDATLWKSSAAVPNMKELKGQSDTDLVAAALISTMSFTSGLARPGGYFSDGPYRGLAILSVNPSVSYQVFQVANQLAFMFSLFAVLCHFCTKHLYIKVDIIHQLNVAIFCTVSSIFAMMVAFIAGSYATEVSISSPAAIILFVSSASFFFLGFYVLLRMMRQYKHSIMWTYRNVRC